MPQGLASLQPLTGLTSLTSLSVVHVGLTDASLATLPVLAGLTRLDVRSNSIATVPASVAQLPRLATLLVHGNPVLTDSPRTALASLKGRAIDVDVAPDRPEVATSIADLAARLYYLPLEMLEYVTNTVVFQPYSGAMKGPLATLQTKAGNDWDTNSLLASLYAVAGIPTRYVAGVVEVTEGQLKDFVGARDAAAAGSILARSGLGYDQYWNRFKHTWLEALVTVPATGQQAWVPIDASWKLRDFRPGVPDILTKVPFSPQEADYLTNPVWQKKSTAEYYEAKVAGWLAQNRPELTIADVGYDGPIRQQSFPAIPTALPYCVVSQPAESARPASIPAAALHTAWRSRLRRRPWRIPPEPHWASRSRSPLRPAARATTAPSRGRPTASSPSASTPISFPSRSWSRSGRSPMPSSSTRPTLSPSIATRPSGGCSI